MEGGGQGVGGLPMRGLGGGEGGLPMRGRNTSLWKCHALNLIEG